MRCAAEGEVDHFTMSSEQALAAQHKWFMYNALADRYNWSMRRRSDLAWPYLRFFRLFEGKVKPTNTLITEIGAALRLTARAARAINRTEQCCPPEDR